MLRAGNNRKGVGIPPLGKGLGYLAEKEKPTQRSGFEALENICFCFLF